MQSSRVNRREKVIMGLTAMLAIDAGYAAASEFAKRLFYRAGRQHDRISELARGPTRTGRDRPFRSGARHGRLARWPKRSGGSVLGRRDRTGHYRPRDLDDARRARRPCGRGRGSVRLHVGGPGSGGIPRGRGDCPDVRRRQSSRRLGRRARGTGPESPRRSRPEGGAQAARAPRSSTFRSPRSTSTTPSWSSRERSFPWTA